MFNLKFSGVCQIKRMDKTLMCSQKYEKIICRILYWKAYIQTAQNDHYSSSSKKGKGGVDSCWHHLSRHRKLIVYELTIKRNCWILQNYLLGMPSIYRMNMVNLICWCVLIVFITILIRRKRWRNSIEYWKLTVIYYWLIFGSLSLFASWWTFLSHSVMRGMLKFILKKRL